MKLDITIIMASDVTKSNAENADGDGAGRGSYMIQHLSDVVITFKESESHAFEAMYSCTLPDDSKPSDIKIQIGTKKFSLSNQQKKVWNEMNSVTAHQSQFEKDFLNDGEKWVAAVVSKNRGYRTFSPIYIFKQGKKFEEVSIWSNILPTIEDEY